MTSVRAVNLRWTGEGQAFRGSGASGGEIVLDGENREGPSPTEALVLSLAACMAIDLKMILEKGRVPLEDLKVTSTGERADEPPRKFTALRLHFRLTGPGEGDRGKVERALSLSRDKYCSVLHTLRPDLDLEIETELID